MPARTRIARFADEKALCAVAMAALQGQGYDVHGEVTLAHLEHPPRVDLVVIKPGDRLNIAAIHAKLRLGKEVIRQARQTIPYAPYTFILMPGPTGWDTRTVVNLMRNLRDAGIGLCCARPDGKCWRALEAKPNRAARTMYITDALDAEVRSPRPAGSSGGCPSTASIARFKPIWEHLRDTGERIAGKYLFRAVGQETRFLGTSPAPWTRALRAAIDARQTRHIRYEEDGPTYFRYVHEDETQG